MKEVIILFIALALFNSALFADVMNTPKYKAMDRYCKQVGVSNVMKELAHNVNTMITNNGGPMQIDAASYLQSASFANFNGKYLIISTRVDMVVMAKIMKYPEKKVISFFQTKVGHDVFLEDDSNIACSRPEHRVILENAGIIRHEYYTLDGVFLQRTDVSNDSCRN